MVGPGPGIYLGLVLMGSTGERRPCKMQESVFGSLPLTNLNIKGVYQYPNKTKDKCTKPWQDQTKKQRNQTFASNELRGVSGPGAWINVIVSEGKARGSGASERKAGRELFLC